ncbi:MAG: T3SS (YopN, CesT) and YbjN peptide-binding chaperone 1 [Solirubrobacterales bacterium]
MAFQTQPQKDVYDRIAVWIPELFGMFGHALPDQPVFVVQLGQTFTMVSVQPWGDDDATITSRAYVAMDTELTADLMHYLLLQNNTFRFGAFGIDDDDDIFFEHTVVGSTLDTEELKSSVLAVSGTADRFADEIIPKWGGQRQSEKIAGN